MKISKINLNHPLFNFRNKIIKKNIFDTSLTFENFFLDRYYPFSQSTKRRSKLDWYVYHKHLAHPFGHRLLSEISAENIDRWMTKQIQEKYKASTVNKHAGLLNRMLNVAVEWEYIEKNPFDKAIIKKFPTGDHVQRFLTADEIRRLLSACSKEPHPYLYFFVKLLLLTGARSSELRLCKWNDIDLTKGELYIGLSKNGRSRRIILSDSSIQELCRVKETSESLGTPTMASNWVFTNPKTQLPYTSMQIAFSKARKRARLDTVRIHDLRHTFASLLINNGASIYEVQKLLGHHHVSMTERYAHLFPNTLKDRAEIIAGSLLKAKD
ncbi:site-specific integrase [uncultured Planktomarina sp.]|uniref:tyrosine-type recombinase/integrase n=2 Tax=Planktomarina TaxID=1284657 RepID=UPI00326108C4